MHHIGNNQIIKTLAHHHKHDKYKIIIIERENSIVYKCLCNGPDKVKGQCNDSGFCSRWTEIMHFEIIVKHITWMCVCEYSPYTMS